MSQFLYGAAVQGIQSFIFQTNELKDVVGASELINKICTEAFDEFKGNGRLVLHAAGNIKCIFTDEEQCRKAVLEFPRKVMNMAPGITISQAVVPYYGDFDKSSDELEKLIRAQRNVPVRSLTLGLMATKRSNKTGLPTVFIDDNGDFLDAGTVSKRYSFVNGTPTLRGTTSKLCNLAFGYYVEDRYIAHNIEDLTSKNDWIAVIHADGNGLGQVVQKVRHDINDYETFSTQLNEATIAACQAASEKIINDYSFEKAVPIRPIVLGGDDLTVICRGDVALDFTRAYMEKFEKETKNRLSDILLKYNVFAGGADHLTACAGIAFIKSSYPFYYGYNLAESLCSEAKKDAKRQESIEANHGLAPSCLMFHKVQDSFIEDYVAIAKRELSPQENISWQHGPYYVDDDMAAELKRWSITELLQNVSMLNSKEGNAVKSHLRQWMGLMHDDEDKAKQTIKRTVSMLKKYGKDTELSNFMVEITTSKNREGKQAYPVYDMLSIHSVINQVTKTEEQ